MTKAFLEADEQALYDSIVHGLRSQGWSRMDAEGEALARIERQRQRYRDAVPNSFSWDTCVPWGLNRSPPPI
jgi:hypothetical protein